jgi:EAL domain-containing protein (putative c-di-GMP-specific phosphodiesterase class I)
MQTKCRTDLGAGAAEPAALQRLLEIAINRDALGVHYQPQYELESGRSCGVEALARWTLASGEIVPPSVFIPIAEHSDLIHDLGAAMLNAACRATVAWGRRSGQSLTLAVNVSALQINEGFRQVLRGALEASGFPAGRLQLEVTESALIANVDRASEYLNDWRRLGVRIALDDFGSGYSGFSYLTRLPVDAVKIDRALVDMMTRDSKCARVMRAIIELGSDLGLDVIAEGVETEQQFQMLRDFNCPKLQGFLLARPLPARQARAALDRPWGNRRLPTEDPMIQASYGTSSTVSLP